MRKYYGVETEKALKNFQISATNIKPDFVKALAKVKLAALFANYELKQISSPKFAAIKKVINEIIDGKHKDQFLLDQIQGGAGTSINMNINEVIAIRASELSGIDIHYLDDVNKSQSTNDVLPTALKVLTLDEIDEVNNNLSQLMKSFKLKGKEYGKVMKPGRTHLQDALPITFGQLFESYASLTSRLIEYLTDQKKYFLRSSLGGTAIGTSVNTPKRYSTKVSKYLSEITCHKFIDSIDKIDLTQNSDIFLQVMAVLNTALASLSKVVNDLRLMASGPKTGFSEITLPVYQKGSTIMPAKNNPVTLEAFNQISNEIAGCYQSVYLDTIQGQLELNVMMPNIIKSIRYSFTIFINGLKLLTQTVENIKVNEKRCEELVKNSLIMKPLEVSEFGYDKVEKEILDKLK